MCSCEAHWSQPAASGTLDPTGPARRAGQQLVEEKGHGNCCSQGPYYASGQDRTTGSGGLFQPSQPAPYHSHLQKGKLRHRESERLARG